MTYKPVNIGRSTRLQGAELAEIRSSLKMDSYRVSDNGNICAHLIHKRNKKRYHHWLNPKEKEKFEKVKHLYPLFSIYRAYPPKPGQRKFMLKCGYSEEQLNNMTSWEAKTIIREQILNNKTNVEENNND